jgi:hypothetical protein
MTWAGMGAIGTGGGHVQVTAYGSGNARCKVASWGSQHASVTCFDVVGNPVDSQYTALLVRPNAADEGLAFAWADQSASASYAPSASYAFNSGGGPVTGTRVGVGNYAMTFDGFGDFGLGGGHVQVTAYGPLVDTRCGVNGWIAGTAYVRCHDGTGNPVDSRYDVLFLRPIAVPEPAVGSMLMAGIGLGLLRRRGRARYERAASRSCGIGPLVRAH